jgi:hypothetical protein
MGYRHPEPERPALRLTSTIIAVFLALAMAIFPIAGVRSAAVMGHHGGAAVQHGGHHASAADHGADHATAATDDCSGHEAPAGKQAGCCDMGACHVFAATLAATFLYAAAPVGTFVQQGDEQVRGERSVRIERPPRTA